MAEGNITMDAKLVVKIKTYSQIELNSTGGWAITTDIPTAPSGYTLCFANMHNYDSNTIPGGLNVYLRSATELGIIGNPGAVITNLKVDFWYMSTNNFAVM